MNAAALACAPSGTSWDGINWADAQRRVRGLQARTVKAVQDGRHNKAKALKWLLTHSFMRTQSGLLCRRQVFLRGDEPNGCPIGAVIRLSEGDTQAFDWAGCAIKVEFLPADDSDETARRRALLAGRLAVQEHLEQYLVALPNVQGILYDHRAVEAADYICITKNADEHVCRTQIYFLNVAAVIAMVTSSNTEQGRNTVIGLIEKGRDR
ncbi:MULTISPECIES: reverse transcriptase N-terminal domain-containing protein [unclassified Pseudomonas]|uniref:reverse transcriptase N-terminal domain-containing protein n=1 Tax=unclassified Pseudomonas TaxID=196821 RepID=UPI0021139CD0|nr:MULTISPECIES: reverse transcriptase N-terminal domain-containing protein [unclassified Pseudomonas]